MVVRPFTLQIPELLWALRGYLPKFRNPFESQMGMRAVWRGSLRIKHERMERMCRGIEAVKDRRSYVGWLRSRIWKRLIIERIEPAKQIGEDRILSKIVPNALNRRICHSRAHIGAKMTSANRSVSAIENQVASAHGTGQDIVGSHLHLGYPARNPMQPVERAPWLGGVSAGRGRACLGS